MDEPSLLTELFHLSGCRLYRTGHPLAYCLFWLIPHQDQRSLVESASAFGITQAEIATQLKISEPTLRKHFREELDGVTCLLKCRRRM